MANDSQRLIQETVLSLLLEKGEMFSDKDDMRTFNQKVYEKIRWVKPPNYIRTHVSNAQKRIKENQPFDWVKESPRYMEQFRKAAAFFQGGAPQLPMMPRKAGRRTTRLIRKSTPQPASPSLPLPLQPQPAPLDVVDRDAQTVPGNGRKRRTSRQVAQQDALHGSSSGPSMQGDAVDDEEMPRTGRQPRRTRRVSRQAPSSSLSAPLLRTPSRLPSPLPATRIPLKHYDLNKIIADAAARADGPVVVPILEGLKAVLIAREALKSAVRRAGLKIEDLSKRPVAVSGTRSGPRKACSVRIMEGNIKDLKKTAEWKENKARYQPVLAAFDKYKEEHMKALGAFFAAGKDEDDFKVDLNVPAPDEGLGVHLILGRFNSAII